MAKSLNDILTELGYEAIPAGRRKIIVKKGKFIGLMSAGECWNYLRHQHPEYFEGVN